MVHRAILGGVLAAAMSGGLAGAQQACGPTAYPYTLANQTVADATQVMADLGCPVYGLAHYTGYVGIGTTTPGSPLSFGSTIVGTAGTPNIIRL